MLRKPKPSQKGLKKLPTAVRNKMGYMKDGGGIQDIKDAAKKSAGSLGMASGSLMDIAKKIKSDGRLSTDDLKKAKDMMRKKSRVDAPQTKTLNRPKQSVFQQLKKAQMLRKHDGRGKK